MFHDQVLGSLWHDVYKQLDKASPERVEKLLRGELDYMQKPKRVSDIMAISDLKNAFKHVMPILKRDDLAVFYIPWEVDRENDNAFDEDLCDSAEEFFNEGFLRLPYKDVLFIINLDVAGELKRIPIVCTQEPGDEHIYVFPMNLTKEQEALINYGGIMGPEKQIEYMFYGLTEVA